MDGDWTDIRDETVTDYLRDDILTHSSLVSSITGNPVVKPGIGSELYYNLKTDGRGSSLDISANYSAYYDNSRIGTDITGDTPQNWIQQTVQDFRAAEAKAVYRHIFSDGSILNSGLEHTSTLLDNSFSEATAQTGTTASCTVSIFPAHTSPTTASGTKFCGARPACAENTPASPADKRRPERR